MHGVWLEQCCQCLWHLYFERFRKVPPFGPSTINHIGNDVTEIKRLAARDYEDILQVGNILTAISVYHLLWVVVLYPSV